jgi:hypothetical protein
LAESNDASCARLEGGKEQKDLLIDSSIIAYLTDESYSTTFLWRISSELKVDETAKADTLDSP